MYRSDVPNKIRPFILETVVNWFGVGKAGPEEALFSSLIHGKQADSGKTYFLCGVGRGQVGGW